jgi:phage tail-like protein
VIRLRALAAEPHPEGNRIDLAWVHPDPAGFPRVRVVRREGTHPTAPGDGVVVSGPRDEPSWEPLPGGERAYRLADTGLPGGRVYYYALFPYDAVPSGGPPEPENRAASLAVDPAGHAGRMEDLLPAVYRRYDQAAALRNPAGLEPEDRGKGPLRRLLDVTGSQLDLLQGLARALLDSADPDRVDGRLLPLLAEWIGWPTDHRLEVAEQRSELRQAPFVYHTVGIIPTLEATVKRVLGWESRVKEFAHNVVLTNHPERLNLWARERRADGTWAGPPEPFALHEAYEGRPAAARANDGTLWLFFHTLRKGRWAVWTKTRPPGGAWTPSRPLSDGDRGARHPAAALVGTTLWAFWDTYDPAADAWAVEARTRTGSGEWTPGALPWSGAAPRRWPAAAADAQGGLWLFWMERADGRWRMRFSRRAGGAWSAPRYLPDGAGVEADPFVLAHPAGQVWLLWARRAAGPAPGQTRWEVAYRVKAGLDPSVSDWGPVRTLPRPDPDADDREPAARWDGARLELFWSSTRDRSWSVWRAMLDPAAWTWGAAEEVTGNPYTERAPLPVPLDDGGTLVLHRSNRGVGYASTVYGATRTLDHRYAGATSADTRNGPKFALRGSFEDFAAYTYDAGVGGRRDDRNWYARDTVGVYLTPTSDDPTALQRGRGVVEQALRQFLPAQVRAVLVIEQAPYAEKVYTYDFPRDPEQRRIGENTFDNPLPERYPAALGDGYLDAVPGWSWIRSWSPATPGHRTVNFAAAPVTTPHRTWHVAVRPGG